MWIEANKKARDLKKLKKKEEMKNEDNLR